METASEKLEQIVFLLVENYIVIVGIGVETACKFEGQSIFQGSLNTLILNSLFRYELTLRSIDILSGTVRLSIHLYM